MNPDCRPEGEEEDVCGWKRRRGFPALGEVDAVLVTGSRMWVPCFCDNVMRGGGMEMFLQGFGDGKC